MNKKILFALLIVFISVGCQRFDPMSGTRDPHISWWDLRFTGPSYMVGVIEDSAVVDINGELFRHGSSGAVGYGDPGDEKESAKGWSGTGASGRSVTGADFPRRIFVRWQSIVEPQTYRGWIEIPEEARQIMRTSTARRCPSAPEQRTRVSAAVTLGLAPGGIIQLWVMDNCHRAVKIADARVQAEIEPLGPSQGLTEGRYAYKISDVSKRYIERFGIPYGSW
ncbi:DUF2931 family protein [Pseudomonas sp.]|uniref:DUF2931 family protein n=1 Tax=Pseudomonas sp. TaxID=306 RepID=UPI00261FDFD6|nr:DUF2931 family protein [Pseudomonas sp.]